MKAQILKIAGVKNEKEFYKKFPTEEAFLKKHGKQLEKAANGMNKKFNAPYTYKPLDMSLTGAMTSNPYMTGKASLDDSTSTNLTANSESGGVEGLLNNLPGFVAAISDIGQTQTDINNLKAYGEISDVAARAAATRPEKRQRKIDYNSMRSQTVNPLGVGTNYLQAEDGAEIQNTFDPNTIYTDMGYEPLNDSTKVKQFQLGGSMSPMLQGFAGNIGSAIGKGTGRGGSYSQLGSIVGDVASAIPGPLGIALKLGLPLAGGIVDSFTQNDEQKALDKVTGNLNAGGFQNSAQSFQSQNSSVMEDGGWVSNDWMPQVITTFGEHKISDLLKPPHDADMLRAGGSVGSGYYTPPSARAMYTGRMDDGGMMHSTNMMFDTDRYPRAEDGSQMAFGGDVRVEDGYLKSLSSDVKEIVGKSHKNGGTPFFNGDHEIEAEGKETVMKTYGDGGPMDDESVTIFGNRYINQDAADFAGVKPGRKYKIESKDLALNQTKFEKKATKNFASANDMEVSDMFSQIEQRTKLLNGEAFTKKADMAKQQLKDLAIYQNETGDVAKSFGLDINAFDKGITKPIKESDMAKFGAKLETADKGKKVKYDPEFENFIDQAMMLEQANSSQQITPSEMKTPIGGEFRGGGTNFGTNNPSITTREKAKEYYYKNYWSKVKDLPAGLRTRALQLAINTGDPYGELMVASGKMSVADRAATKDQRKDKAITGNKDWEKSKADILKAYKEDPQAFLGKLDSEQNRYYDSIIANNPSDVNSNTRKEFFDDYTGLAKYASQPYISQQQNAPMVATAPVAASSAPTTKELWQIPKKERAALAIANGIKNYTGTKEQNMKLLGIINKPAPQPTASNFLPTLGIDDSGYVPSDQKIDARRALMPDAYGSFDMDTDEQTMAQMAQQSIPKPPAGTTIENFGAKSDSRNQEKKGGNDFINTSLATLNSLVPFWKQTSQRQINPDQLLPAYMSMSQNQLEPVQAQLYNPMAQAQPYRVSLQDQRNEVNAQARAAFKQSVGNPSAAAMIASQASDANNKINAEENRINQAETMRAAESNRALMNDAQRINLGIQDQQYTRQSQAASNTKAQSLEIAKYFAQMQAENRKVNNRQAILENMYPAFAYTKSGVAYKDPRYTAMFNIPDTGEGATSKEDITSPANFFKNEETAKKKTGRNGAIVKAIKGL
jgi:hypothetical protein